MAHTTRNDGQWTARERARISNRVAAASEHGPTLARFLDMVHAYVPEVRESIEGMWCGRDGAVTLDIEGQDHMLCFGWHEGRVEYAYVS